MVKIKRKVEMTLPELIEWGYKNEIKDKYFVSNQANHRLVTFDSIGWVDFSNDYYYPPRDTYTVEIEEEITEETEIPEMLEIFQDNDGTQWFGNSIEQLKDDFSREFWLKDGDTMTLIWKDGELVGDE
ncbi:hypothetical protein [Staphylococcus hominis]|uniref:hypothetical protein n=1 Tax=Staphylococcus hominis TaxID=1290 RepID=UPI00115D23F1|nr:hypothetical protein [Staphylococcus hominis]TRL32684.1 hypothetical protein FNL05_06985 [Staphylococcus hominis]